MYYSTAILVPSLKFFYSVVRYDGRCFLRYNIRDFLPVWDTPQNNFIEFDEFSPVISYEAEGFFSRILRRYGFFTLYPKNLLRCIPKCRRLYFVVEIMIQHRIIFFNLNVSCRLQMKI